MVDIHTIKITVKVTFRAMMAGVNGYCRCCHAFEVLEMLHSPELDAYKLICDFQIMNNDDNKIVSCFRCREFLKEIYHFRIEFKGSGEIFPQNLDVKCHNIKILREANDNNSSLLEMKTKVVDKYDGIDEIDIHINKVEVDSDPERSKLLLENKMDEVAEEPGKELQVSNNEIHNRMINPNSQPIIEGSGIPNWDVLKAYFTQKDNEERPFPCEHCNYCGKTKSGLFEHMKSHIKDRERPHKCPECSYMTTTLVKLKSHISFKHNEERPFPCEHCNYYGKTKNCLTKHMKIHTKDCDKTHKCSKCSYMTTSMDRLKSHFIYRHSDEKPFRCEHCDYSAKTKNTLSRHMIRTHPQHSSKPLINLEEHVASKQSDESSFTCDLCDYCAKTQSDLSIHMKVHIDKPYKCSKCSYRASFMSNLKEHVRYTHSDERPFPCEHCDYRSKTKSQLTRHIITHARACDKPHKCTQCSYTTVFKSNLKSHVTYRHNDEKSFPCEHCNRSFKTIYVLSKHVKKHHTEHCDKS